MSKVQTTVRDWAKTKATVEAAKVDIRYLARLTTGYDLPSHATRIYNHIREAQAEGEAVMVLASVGHLKSTVANLCMLQDMLTDPNVHIIFASKAYKVVRRASEWLRRHLRSITGKMGDVWADKVFTAPGWDGKDGNPTWAGATQGEAIEGIRGTRCYLDDPIDADSQTSSVFRGNAIEWYNHTLRPRLNRGAQVTTIGSPWHPDDLYASLVRRGVRTHIFPMKRSACVPLWSDRPNIVWHGEEYDMLWPENWKEEDTPKLMNDVGGPVAFDQRYMCNPQAIMGRRFKPEWFTFWDKMPDLENCVIEFGLDPAISKSEISDNTSLCIIAFNKTSKLIYVLDNPAGHWDFNETVTHLKNYAKQYHPTRITIEKAAYQQALVDYLMGNTTLPVLGQPAIGDKVSRIDTLAVPIQSGRIVFGKDQHELIQELLYFPDGSHDDRADSLEVAVRHILRGESWGAPVDLSEGLKSREEPEGVMKPQWLGGQRDRFSR